MEQCDNTDVKVKATHCAFPSNGAHQVFSLSAPASVNLREESQSTKCISTYLREQNKKSNISLLGAM